MAEVLITIVVIGIIAAITVPVVIANHKKIETAAKLKKFYSNLTNAVNLSEIDNGVKAHEWDYTLSNISYFERYLAPYFNYYKIEEVQYDYFENGLYKDHAVYLNDGGIIYFDDSGAYSYDVNGDKGPNEYGRDIFSFMVNGSFGHIDEKLTAVYVDACSCNYNKKANECSREEMKTLCNGAKSRGCCTLLIQSDGWEIKNDYPLKL